MQIIHQTGDSSWNIDGFIPQQLRSRYIARDFFSADYSDILAAAHIVLSRSGAGSLWELGVAGKPTVFIPLSTGTRGDQLRNARHAEGHGAALVCTSESEMKNLAATVIRLAVDSPRLKAMSGAWKGLVHNEGTKRIVRLIEHYLETGVISAVVQEGIR